MSDALSQAAPGVKQILRNNNSAMLVFQKKKRNGKDNHCEENCQRGKSEKRRKDETDQAEGSYARACAHADASRKIAGIIVSVRGQRAAGRYDE